jgi:hypothetical protein
MIRLLLLLAIPLAAASAAAQTPVYRVDLIVYLDRQGSASAGLPPLERPAAGLSLQDEAALAAAGIRVLPESEFGLDTEWRRLSNARDYQPLVRLAWEQERPPSRRGPRLEVTFGQPFELVLPDAYTSELRTPLSGSVSLTLSRYLHLDVDLQYLRPPGANARAYRLREQRRLRRDELHYLDSQLLGVLARVSRVDRGGEGAP